MSVLPTPEVEPGAVPPTQLSPSLQWPLLVSPPFHDWGLGGATAAGVALTGAVAVSYTHLHVRLRVGVREP